MYNIEYPTWNTSYSNNKLSLKLDWKLSQAKNNTDSISPCVRSNLMGSGFHSPTKSFINNSMYSTPRNPIKNSFNDSGYKSCTTQNNNKHFNAQSASKFPSTKLFSSPSKSPSKKDIYRPKMKKDPVNNDIQVSNKEEKNPVKDKVDIPMSSEIDNPVNHPDIHETMNCSKNQARVTDNESNIELSNTSSPIVSSTDISNKNSQVYTKQVSDSDDELYSDPDYNTHANFCPLTNSFAKQRKRIKISNGILSDNIDAEYMNLDGVCRLCNKHVPSYLAGRHVFECPRSDLNAVNDFCVQQAKKLKSKCKDILNVILEIQSVRLQDDKFPKTIFKNIKSYHKFAILVDKLEQSQTDTFFKEYGLPTSRVVDILSYEHLC